MTQRKLIKFGNASLAVTLPKVWTLKNKLKKGDEIPYEITEEGDLKFSINQEKYKIPETITTISTTNKTLDQIQREIVSAYIKNSQIITLEGKDLFKQAKEIKQIIQNFMALEIMEQTKERIVAKDFLDIQNITLLSIIKRIDIILRNILSDAKAARDKEAYENLIQRDEDINRLTFLVYRVANFIIRHPQMIKKEKSLVEVIKYTKVAESLESIGDETKKIASILSRYTIPKNDKLQEIYGIIELFYKNTLNALYKEDKDLALKLAAKKKELIKKCEEIADVENKKELILHLYLCSLSAIS